MQSFNPCPAYAGHGNDCIKQKMTTTACLALTFALGWSFPFALDWSKARGPMPAGLKQCRAEAKARVQLLLSWLHFLVFA